MMITAIITQVERRLKYNFYSFWLKKHQRGKKIFLINLIKNEK